MPEADAVVKKIRAALEVDPRVNLHRHPVRVRREGTEVVLEGDVDSLAAKKIALRRAREADGAPVVDALRVAAAESLGDGAIRDLYVDALTQQAEFTDCTIRAVDSGRSELVRDVRDDRRGEIEVAVRDGVVELRGTVQSPSHRRVAGVIAWWTRGVRDVANVMEVDPPREDNDEEMLDAVALVLEMDPAVDESQLTVLCEGGTVTLNGFVPTDEQRRRAERDAWAVDGVVDVVNRVQLTA